MVRERERERGLTAMKTRREDRGSGVAKTGGSGIRDAESEALERDREGESERARERERAGVRRGK